MASTIGSLLVEIGADISGLEVGGKNATKTLRDVGERSRELGNELAKLGAAAAAAGAVMAAAFVKGGLDAIDSQAKLARALGGTIDGLRGLQLAANEAGVSSETLKSSMQQFNAKLGEVQRGTGEARKVIALLGLDAAKLSQMDLDERMATVADRIRDLGLSTAQAADVLNKFGITNTEVVDLMRQGGDVIRSARRDIDEFGLSLSAVDAAKVEMANDAMGRISLTFEAIRNKITVALAPILKALADKFNETAKANKGFGDQAIQVFETVMRWVGKFADVLHGLRVTFKGVELVATGAWAGIVSGAQLVAETVAAMVDGINKPINAVIRKMNELGANIAELPSISDSDFMVGMRKFAEEARNKVGDVRTELHNLAMQEMPSDKIAAFLEDVKIKAQEAAQAVVAAQSGGGTFESPNEQKDKEEERQAAELEKQREALQAKLDQVMEFAMAEDELEIKRHEERLTRLSEGLALELITVEEARATMEALEEDHMKRMADIRKKGWSDIQKFQNSTLSKQVGQVSGYLADITAGVARENKAMFEINKAAGIANAIVAAYEGISKTLGAYPYPINIALAAAHAVAAFAQVSAIKSQSFSASAAAPSLAGGTPATPVTPVTGGTPPAAGGGGGGSVLTVEGISEDQIFSGRTIRAIAERLAEHVRDGGTVQFA